MTNAAAMYGWPGCGTGAGNISPLLLRYTPGSNCAAWRTEGNRPVMTVYQKKSCNSSGTLRTVSTYSDASRTINQLLDSRAMPTSTPMPVASTMPSSDTRSVFRMPTR